MLNKTMANGATKRIPTAMVGTAPRVEIMTITPEMAAAWLARNSGSQRPISDGTVEMYARDMAGGRWQLTHQGISFNQTGEVIDGQHRLHAIVKAGTPIEMAVATGFAVEFGSPIDQGRGRTVAHVLHNHSRWVAIVRTLLFLSRGDLTNWARVSLAEIREAAEAHSEALDNVWPSLRSLPAGMSASIAWTLPIGRDRVLSFANQVLSGEMLERGDPAFALRNWRERNRRASQYEYIGATLNCIRAVLVGESLVNVFTGPTGYRWSCQRRRAERVPHTPSPQIVPAPGDQANAKK